MTPHSRKSAGALLVCAALVGAACGGSSPEADGAPSTTVVDDIDDTVAAAPETPSTDVSGLDDSVARGETPWDGDDFVTLADARMDALAATFDLELAPSSVASIFEYPDDFPYPMGNVIGIFHDHDLDLRFDDEVRIDEERIVAIDGAGDAARLDALQVLVGSGTVSRWQGSSSQRTDTNLDLYSAPSADSDLKDYLAARGNPTPEAGEPYFQLRFDQRATEIPVPSWQEGLPILDGGRLIGVQEGRGIVESFGRIAEDGYVELRYLYPLERFEELEALFASGIFESAGFTYDDTPFSNFDIRIDLSNGGWVGTVGVGSVSVNGEDVGYQLLWSLTRPGLVDAPTPPATDSDTDDAAPTLAPEQRPDIESGVESSPDAPAPLAGSTFRWDDRNVQWNIVLHGLVEAETKFSNDIGRCVHLIGTATPTFIDGDFATGDSDLPKVGLLAGDQYVKSGTDCATSDLTAAGYDEFSIDGAILGAPLNFAGSFFLEGTVAATIDAVVVGDEDDPAEMGGDDDDNSYFSDDVIAAIPPRSATTADLTPPESTPLAGTRTNIGIDGDVRDATFHGLIEVAPTESTINLHGDGRCLVVVGESTPTNIDNGYVTDDAPTMRLIAGGQIINGYGFCEIDPITAAGYRPHNQWGSTTGTTTSFQESFFVPASVADQVTTLVVDARADERQFLDADIIETLPPSVGVADGFELPESEGAMTDGPISWTNQRGDEVEWSIQMDGLVPIGSTNDGTATCHAVVGTITPASDVDSNFSIPDFSILARGVEFTEAGARCDVDALEALGYAPSNDAQVSAGTEFAFYDAIVVANEPARELDRIVVGDASTDLQSQAYDIVVIAAPL